MTTVQQIEQLIQLLAEGTQTNSLQWQATSNEDTFRLPSGSGNILVTREERFNSEDDTTFTYRNLSIFNDKGRVIEEFSPRLEEDCNNFDELFTLARRSAMKSDEILRKLIGEIQEKVHK